MSKRMNDWVNEWMNIIMSLKAVSSSVHDVGDSAAKLNTSKVYPGDSRGFKL